MHSLINVTLNEYKIILSNYLYLTFPNCSESSHRMWTKPFILKIQLNQTDVTCARVLLFL